jgi:hypothetical protein
MYQLEKNLERKGSLNPFLKLTQSKKIGQLRDMSCSDSYSKGKVFAHPKKGIRNAGKGSSEKNKNLGKYEPGKKSVVVDSILAFEDLFGVPKNSNKKIIRQRPDFNYAKKENLSMVQLQENNFKIRNQNHSGDRKCQNLTMKNSVDTKNLTGQDDKRYPPIINMSGFYRKGDLERVRENI